MHLKVGLKKLFQVWISRCSRCWISHIPLPHSSRMPFKRGQLFFFSVSLCIKQKWPPCGSLFCEGGSDQFHRNKGFTKITSAFCICDGRYGFRPAPKYSEDTVKWSHWSWNGCAWEFSYKKALKAHDLKGTKNRFSRISVEIFELRLNLTLRERSFSFQIPEKETSSLPCTVVSYLATMVNKSNLIFLSSVISSLRIVV